MGRVRFPSKWTRLSSQRARSSSGGHGLIEIVMQPGWGDLYTSVVGTAILLGPLWIILAIAQELGIGMAKDVLCSAGRMGVSLPFLITLGLEIVMVFFLLKFLIRVMISLAERGWEP
ncbi:hypothetical protein [Halocatena marina]